MKLLLTSAIVTLGLLVPSIAFGQEDYVLLAPLPGLESTGDLNANDTPVENYLTTLYQIGVSIVLVIAVVMFIFGGIQYMTSDSIGGKSNGRETITKALIGILLAVGSYLLLFLIGGPSAVQIGLNVEDVGFVEAPERNDQICEITYSASASDHNGFFGRPDYANLPQCACDESLERFDCPHASLLFGNSPPVTIDVSDLGLHTPGFRGQCVDVGRHPAMGETVFIVTQTPSRVGACGASEGSIDDPNDHEDEGEGESQQAATALAVHPDIQMSLQEISVPGEEYAALHYLVEWENIAEDERAEGGVEIKLGLYTANESGEFVEPVWSEERLLGDINEQSDSKREDNSTLISYQDLFLPTVARLRVYNLGGELLSERLYGFGVPVNNSPE